MEIPTRKNSVLTALATLVLVMAILYWGRPVLMPLALAVLLTFLLNPIVHMLHSRGVPRAPAVVLVVLFVFSFLGAIGWSIGVQLGALAGDLPEYKDNIRQKMSDFRTAGKGSTLERIQETFKELAGEIEREKELEEAESAAARPDGTGEGKEKPVPVVVQGETALTTFLPTAVAPLAEVLVTAGLVIVLVIFMLLRLQDMRNRIIRLVGYARLTATTKALDEAGERISRYLLMQSLINGTYGLALGLALYFIGLPYVVLWGFLAAIVRFIPYVGPWLGAIFPVAFSLVVFDGWLQPFMIFGCILTLELVSNMVMEPLLYGQSAGVSEIAIVLALAFWTMLWGPVGLALATPLTVCVVVLSKHIPGLQFIDMLLGDEPVMENRLVYYQRLLAMDRHEAMLMARQSLQQKPVETVFDELLLPALNFARRDLTHKKITDEDHASILESTREILGKLDLVLSSREEKQELTGGALVPSLAGLRILGIPAQEGSDELVLEMLRRVLELKGYEMEVLAGESVVTTSLSMIESFQPAAVCVVSIAPDSLGMVRSICKRLRSRFPGLIIIAGRFGFHGNLAETRDQLISAGANSVASSLEEAALQIPKLLPMPDGKKGVERVGSDFPRSAPIS
jgi:predicted PurR-regulated permease PerM